MAPYLVFAAAAFAAFYIVAGYPILLALFKARRAPAVKKDLSYRPTVSVVMAVHNGESQLRQKFETLLAQDYPRDLVQIVVVSDGSTDATESIAEEHASHGVILVRAHKGGKAAALNRGFEKATGEIVFFTDVRQPLDPGAIRHLAANFADPSIGAVTGEMKLVRGDSGEQADMDLYWRYEVWARARHSEIYSMFVTTGCVYAMRRSLAGPIPPDTLTDDLVLPLRAYFAGYRVVFDPAAIAYDRPAIAGTELRRRFRTLAGLWQTVVRHPRIFAPHPMRWHFLSHKVARLALPWALIAMPAAALAMPDSWFRTAILAASAAFAGLALMNSLVPARWPLKRLSSPARTFLAMNLASLVSVGVFFLPAGAIWKPTKVAK